MIAKHPSLFVIAFIAIGLTIGIYLMSIGL